MNCAKCGKPIADNLSFCPHCGSANGATTPGGANIPYTQGNPNQYGPGGTNPYGANITQLSKAEEKRKKGIKIIVAYGVCEFLLLILMLLLPFSLLMGLGLGLGLSDYDSNNTTTSRQVESADAYDDVGNPLYWDEDAQWYYYDNGSAYDHEDCCTIDEYGDILYWDPELEEYYYDIYDLVGP